jgi:hypothetical protein
VGLRSKLQASIQRRFSAFSRVRGAGGGTPARGREWNSGVRPHVPPPVRAQLPIQEGLSLSGGSIEGDSNERFVGGRRDEGENLHRKRDGQSGQTGQ